MTVEGGLVRMAPLVWIKLMVLNACVHQDTGEVAAEQVELLFIT